MLKGLGKLADLADVMKHARQLGSKLQEVNDRLKAQRVSGSAGGGLVEVEANGLGELLAVRIEPSLFDKGDREMVEDLLPAACNQAVAKAKELHAQQVKSMTDGLELPGLGDLMDKLAKMPDEEGRGDDLPIG